MYVLFGKNTHGTVPSGLSHTIGDFEICGMCWASTAPKKLAQHLYCCGLPVMSPVVGVMTLTCSILIRWLAPASP